MSSRARRRRRRTTTPLSSRKAAPSERPVRRLTRAAAARDPEVYGRAVLAGDIPACRWVRLAVERHHRDLRRRPGGIWFDPSAATRVLIFFERYLRHSKGEWAGRPLALEPWQRWLLWVLFGWRRKDGRRRFRQAYIEIPRKNGKSTMCAGIGLYLLDADGEPGAEVYTLATKRDQARIVHGESVRMVRSAPSPLRQRIKPRASCLSVGATESKYEPLGADSTTLDGLNVHGAIADELHRWPDRDLLDVIETATGARRQPLIVRITTAGEDLESVCGDDHEYTERILQGEVRDDDWFGIVYTIDPGDDPFSPISWAKANPNLDVSVKRDDLAAQAARAQEQPAKLGALLRLRLNVWSTAGTRLIDQERWRQCSTPLDLEALRGRVCYGGLDLAAVSDLVAWALFFPPAAPDEPAKLLVRQYVPRESLHEAGRASRVSYETWVRQGHLTATPGDVTDIDWVLADVAKDLERFNIASIGFDRYGALNVVNQIRKIGQARGRGDDWVVEYGQGNVSMNAPIVELLRLVLSRRLAHGGNPVLSWEAGNLVARVDDHGNMSPSKRLSRQKIDGVVAALMAIGMALRALPQGPAGVEWC